jgi:hypothetical protein
MAKKSAARKWDQQQRWLLYFSAVDFFAIRFRALPPARFSANSLGTPIGIIFPSS